MNSRICLYFWFDTPSSSITIKRKTQRNSKFDQHRLFSGSADGVAHLIRHVESRSARFQFDDFPRTPFPADASVA